MSLSSKWALILVLFTSGFAHALDIRAIYTSACQRNIGLILNVDSRKINFLDTSGKLNVIPRHNIIFLADYPLDHFPAQAKADLSKLPSHRILTNAGGELKLLIQGWPVGFTKDKVAYLSRRGQEIVIDRESIWQIDKENIEKKLWFGRERAKYTFVHPYAFRDCPNRRSSSRRKIYPRQILSDAVVIKRELDRMEFEYSRINRYVKEQRFYPVPQVYKNETSLGVWQNFGSRYGSSSDRQNNLTPSLETQYASDVFDYQHVFITGSSPLKESVHDEAQTVAYYAFKASYFHFSAMLDPSTVLVGQNYEWQPNDMEDLDNRLNDSTYFDIGFDFGRWTFAAVGNGVNSGVSGNGLYYEEITQAAGMRVTYRAPSYFIDFSAKSGQGDGKEADGSNEDNTSDLSVTRINFDYIWSRSLDLNLSLIQRSFSVDGPLDYSSSSTTGVFGLSYKYTKRIHIRGRASVEQWQAEDTTDSDNQTFFKLGLNAQLLF